MNVCAIMATCGRHTLAERSLGMFLEQIDTQDTKNIYSLLIYNNSDVSIKLAENFMDNVKGLKSVLLVNEHRDSKTGQRYTDLGAIYRDALKHIPDNTDIITHWDDDDLFLPNHLSEGVKGLERGYNMDTEEQHPPVDCKAYKPAKSYYRHPGGVDLMSNTLEPSIFVEAEVIKEQGYGTGTTDQHLQWVNYLVYGKHIFVDEKGPSTLIYNWGDTDIPTFKTSGNAGNPSNFDNYRTFSKDHGDRILTPWTREHLQPYYDLVNG